MLCLESYNSIVYFLLNHVGTVYLNSFVAGFHGPLDSYYGSFPDDKLILGLDEGVCSL